jgi:hypothetical protein
MAVSNPAVPNIHSAPRPNAGFFEKLNTRWHERALQVFMFIVLAHWAEHLVQAYQIYVMGWPRPKALGLLGLWYPWLIQTETLHYGYALVMLIGLWIFRKGFTGRSHTWWMASHDSPQFLGKAGTLQRPAANLPAGRIASFLQLDRVHPDGHRDVLPHVPVRRGGESGLHLRVGPA